MERVQIHHFSIWQSDWVGDCGSHVCREQQSLPGISGIWARPRNRKKKPVTNGARVKKFLGKGNSNCHGPGIGRICFTRINKVRRWGESITLQSSVTHIEGFSWDIPYMKKKIHLTLKQQQAIWLFENFLQCSLCEMGWSDFWERFIHVSCKTQRFISA